jgi:hypothetical protein
MVLNEKDDYLSDRRSAMIRVKQGSPEKSLQRAYDEGFKQGVLTAASSIICAAEGLRRLVIKIDHIDMWEDTDG